MKEIRIFNRSVNRVYPAAGVALVFGIVCAFGVLMFLDHIDGQTKTTVTTASYIVNLPRDTELLKQLSADLMAQTDVPGGDAAALSAIAPAAGEPLAKPAGTIPAYIGPQGN